jgi:hypothetical protein
LVKLPQVRQRHTHFADRLRLLRQIQRWRLRGRIRAALPHALDDDLDVVADFGPAPLDGPLHDFGRLLRQQLHHADILLDAAPWTVLLLQGRT